MHLRICESLPKLSLKIHHSLTVPSDPTVAVSHGAVFRAMNKADGPKRIVQSNFGFLQIEERDLRLPAHRMATPTDGDFDGKMYIENVLDWVIKKVGVCFSSGLSDYLDPTANGHRNLY